MSLSLRPLSEDDVPMLQGQAADDEEGVRRLGMPAEQWWRLVRDDPCRHGWVILEDAAEVGYLDAEQDGGCLYVAMVVFADARGRGVARQVLQRASAEPVFHHVTSIVGCIELDNHVARRAARTAGFVARGLDPDGLMTYQLDRPSRGHQTVPGPSPS